MVFGVPVRALGVEGAVDHLQVVLVETVQVRHAGIELTDQLGLRVGIVRYGDRHTDRRRPQGETLSLRGESPRDRGDAVTHRVASAWVWDAQQSQLLERHDQFDRPTRLPVARHRAQHPQHICLVASRAGSLQQIGRLVDDDPVRWDQRRDQRACIGGSRNVPERNASPTTRQRRRIIELVLGQFSEC